MEMLQSNVTQTTTRIVNLSRRVDIIPTVGEPATAKLPPDNPRIRIIMCFIFMSNCGCPTSNQLRLNWSWTTWTISFIIPSATLCHPIHPKSHHTRQLWPDHWMPLRRFIIEEVNMTIDNPGHRFTLPHNTDHAQGLFPYTANELLPSQ